MLIDFDFRLIPVLAIPFILYIVSDIRKNKRINAIHYVFVTIFFVYFVGLIAHAFFPIFFDFEMARNHERNWSLAKIIQFNVDLIPSFEEVLTEGFFLNIVMTFPLGFLLPFVIKGLNMKKIVVISIITGVAIELIQFGLISIQGIGFRVVDINDSIANALGVFLGYLAFILIVKLAFKGFSKIKKKYRTAAKLDPLFNYILQNNSEAFGNLIG